jgi:hypothetical protein
MEISVAILEKYIDILFVCLIRLKGYKRLSEESINNGLIMLSQASIVSIEERGNLEYRVTKLEMYIDILFTCLIKFDNYKKLCKQDFDLNMLTETTTHIEIQEGNIESRITELEKYIDTLFTCIIGFKTYRKIGTEQDDVNNLTKITKATVLS